MKKIMSLVIICFSFIFFNISTVFGEFIVYGDGNGMFYTDTVLFINAIPIQGYYDGGSSGDGTGKKYFVLAKDLENYGFEVLLDKEAATLDIKRIPGKYPDQLSDEQFHELSAHDNDKRPYVRAYSTNLEVTFDGINCPHYCSYYTNDDCFICVSCLANLYGSMFYERQLDTLYVTIAYDYPVVRTPNYAFAYKTTQSLEDYLYEKFGESKFSALRSDYESGYIKARGANYISFENISKQFKVQYSFTKNAMILQPGQGVQKETLLKVAELKKNKDSSEFHTYSDELECYVTFACLDLKLISGDKEYGNEGNYPVFIGIGGNLYMNLDALADALKE